MKTVLIVLLACINVALLGTLVGGTLVPKAQAQAVRGNTDYLVVTGHIESKADALYILDLAKRRLAVFRIDPTSKKMIAVGARRLKIDFPKPVEDKP
jgi:hypothetical protein